MGRGGEGVGKAAPPPSTHQSQDAVSVLLQAAGLVVRVLWGYYGMWAIGRAMGCDIGQYGMWAIGHAMGCVL